MSIFIFEMGSVSSWIAAIGSIGALFYAIYLSNKGNRIRLEITIIADIARNYFNGDDPNKREACITNLGIRTAHIRSIETCEKKYWKYRTVSNALSGEAPVHASIAQGEMYIYSFSLNAKSWDKDKKYYLCVSELSGKKYYRKLTP